MADRQERRIREPTAKRRQRLRLPCPRGSPASMHCPAAHTNQREFETIHRSIQDGVYNLEPFASRTKFPAKATSRVPFKQSDGASPSWLHCATIKIPSHLSHSSPSSRVNAL